MQGSLPAAAACVVASKSAVRKRSATSTASAASRSGKITTNSSPPYRPPASLRRRCVRTTSATRRSASSPIWWPWWLLIAPKSSRSIIISATERRRPFTCSSRCRRSSSARRFSKPVKRDKAHPVARLHQEWHQQDVTRAPPLSPDPGLASGTCIVAVAEAMAMGHQTLGRMARYRLIRLRIRLITGIGHKQTIVGFIQIDRAVTERGEARGGAGQRARDLAEVIVAAQRPHGREHGAQAGLGIHGRSLWPLLGALRYRLCASACRLLHRSLLQ